MLEGSFVSISGIYKVEFIPQFIDFKGEKIKISSKRTITYTGDRDFDSIEYSKDERRAFYPRSGQQRRKISGLKTHKRTSGGRRADASLPKLCTLGSDFFMEVNNSVFCFF